MSKFVGLIVGGIELAAGIIAIFTPFAFLAPYLIAAGVGTLLSGVGTLLSGSGGTSQNGSSGGISTASRNPVAPWLVCYGQSVVGGTIVFLHEFGDKDKYLDMVIVLACHQCESVDELLFDKQLVQLSTGGGAFTGIGDSFTPLQQTISITHITRVKNVVTATMSAAIPLLTPGDKVKVEGITGDLTLNGTFPVDEVSVDHKTILYVCGGLPAIVDNEGTVSTLWPDYGRKIHMEVLLGNHTDTFPGMLSGTANDGDTSNLITSPDNPWTFAHKLLGKTCVFLRLNYDEKYFSGGLPAISFMIRGKNNIFDPRDSSHGYSNNAALCIADYLSNVDWGFRASYGTAIPNADLIAAANICDESVLLAIVTTPPSFEKRYTINGKFDLSAGRGEVLRNLLTSCAGRLTLLGGQFKIWPAAWLGTSPFAAPEISDMAGPMQWKPTCSIRDLYNGVKGTYISPANNWQASDIPPYAQDEAHGYPSDQNLIDDGGTRRWLDIQLPFTISASMAQRICKIELLRRRMRGTGTVRYNMAGYSMATMDIIALDFAPFGWTGKLFEVLSHRFTLDQVNQGGEEVALLGTQIDIQETDAEVYDWEDTEELTPQGYQQPALPDPTKPAPPTGLTLTSDATTTVLTPSGVADSILVEWDIPVDAYVTNGGHMEIQYREVLNNSDGTVSVTNGLPDVTGAATGFLNAMTGGLLTVNGVSGLIKTIVSPTHIILAVAFSGPTASAMPYVIGYSAAWKGLPSVNASVTQVSIFGVTDGAQYYVQIRSVNAGGVPSPWVIAGPVTANGARVPLPLKPYAEDYLFAPYGYAIGLTQVGGAPGDNSIDINGVRPVNVLSAVEAPVIDPAAVVTATGGVGLPPGSFVAQVFGIDAAGLRTAGSNITQFLVSISGSQAVFSVAFATGTVGYEVFVSDLDKGVNTLVGLGPQVGTPTTITVTAYANVGYGPPDELAIKHHARAKRVIHGGIGIAVVAASTASTVTIGVPNAPTADLWAGRFLMIVSKAGLPNTQSLSIHPIVHNDAGSPLCVITVNSPEGLFFGVGDLVLITMSTLGATLTTTTDPGLAGPFALAGLDVLPFPGVEKGNILRLLYDPTGAGVCGDFVKIGGNTSTAFSHGPWKVAPGDGSVVVVEESAWRVNVTTTPHPNSLAPTLAHAEDFPIVSIPSTDLGGYVALVQLLLQDEHGNDSLELGAGLRMLYIVPGGTGGSDDGRAVLDDGGNPVIF